MAYNYEWFRILPCGHLWGMRPRFAANTEGDMMMINTLDSSDPVM